MSKNTTDIDQYWEEILEDVNYDFLPLEYVNTVIVRFLDGKTWEISVNDKDDAGEDPADILDSFFEEYKETIDTVDFRLDTEQLKKDISRRTKRFLKLNK